MNEGRAALGPASPGAGARPDAFGIDDDLESALLTGLAEAPEASDELDSVSSSDAAAPTSGNAGLRAASSHTGTSTEAAGAPAPPTDRTEEPRVESGGGVGPGSALRSEWTFDEELAERLLVSISARDEPAGRTGSEGPRNGLPAGPARDALVDEEYLAFEPAPGLDPGPREEASAGYPPAPDAAWSAPATAADPDLERTLRDGLSGDSLGDLPPEEPATSASGAVRDSESASHRGPGGSPSVPPPDVRALEAEPTLDTSFAPDSLHHPGVPDALPEEPASSPLAVDLEAEMPALEDVPTAPAPGGEPTVLAFATDAESESALREGLSEHPNPQVWPGGLRSAIMTLGAAQSSPLLFVDLDETAYPAGAIHELAAVCEVGTVVIAFGSDGTARFSREVLLAGVSDYLVKPIAAAVVHEAAARAAASAQADAAQDPARGWSVGFAGTGGSGATTLAAAAALLAAERGRYVSVLDLNRTFPTLSFLLDVEPAPGLVELLSTVARASLHPEVVDGMRAERSDRVTVYGYPWSAVPPPCPPVWAVCELLVELQRRSHLVIVDGLEDPATRISLLALVDARVLVVEPTVMGAANAARTLTRFGPMFAPEGPLVLVQNHTRPLKPKTGARILRDAGVEDSPEVVVPFEPALPAHADRGWPEGRLPRSLRKSFAALADRILAVPAAAPALA